MLWLHIEVSPTEAAPGTELTVNGTGFTPNSSVQLHFWEPVNYSEYDTQSTETDSEGKFSAQHSFPSDLPGGNYWVTGEDVWWANNPHCRISDGGDFTIQANSAPITTEIDTDEDGLPDSWEINGVNGVDLPAMGADPLHKDIFIEIDYMVKIECDTDFGFTYCSEEISHKPKEDALALIVEAFQNARVDNPDGDTGINLHIDSGPGSIMNPETGEKWGDLSRSDALPFQTFLGKGMGENFDDDFWMVIKRLNFRDERAAIFRYCLFVHQLSEEYGTTSGISRTPSTEFVVSLGSWANNVGSVFQQAGTFMHEMGHSMGLDGDNWNPNHLSVMNYSFQDRGLIFDGEFGHFDYSRFPLPEIDENNLDESIGINGGNLVARYGTTYIDPTKPNEEPVNRMIDVMENVNGYINWNMDSDDDGGDRADSNLQLDINGDSTLGNIGNVINEWEKIFEEDNRISSFFAGKQIPQGDFHDELTLEQYEAMPLPLSVEIGGIPALFPEPGTSSDYHFSIKNNGDQSEAFMVEVNSNHDWLNWDSIPEIVFLDPKEILEFSTFLYIPPSVAYGSSEVVSIKVVSMSNPKIFDSISLVINIFEDGDVDGNGIHNVLDIIQMIKFMNNLSVPTGLKDPNRDVVIDENDVFYIAEKIFLENEKFVYKTTGNLVESEISLSRNSVYFDSKGESVCAIQFDILYDDFSIKIDGIEPLIDLNLFDFRTREIERNRERILIFPKAGMDGCPLPDGELMSFDIFPENSGINGEIHIAMIVASDEYGKSPLLLQDTKRTFFASEISDPTPSPTKSGTNEKGPGDTNCFINTLP